MEDIDELDFTKETVENNDTIENLKYPFLIFRLKQKYYAINCSLVSGIMKMPDYTVKTPCPSQYVKGIFELRGEFIPIVALRTLFNMPELDMERMNFVQNIDMGIHDHLHWAEELRRSAEENEPFLLSIDPHGCNFGKWLDTYKPEFYSMSIQMEKIIEPHKALHTSAQKFLDRLKNMRSAEKAEAIEEFFLDLHTNYISKIVALLEEMKYLYDENILEMLIVIDRDDRHLAIVADDIISVENIDTEYSMENMEGIDASRYVAGVRHSGSLDADVLIIDDVMLTDSILAVI